MSLLIEPEGPGVIGRAFGQGPGERMGSCNRKIASVEPSPKSDTQDAASPTSATLPFVHSAIRTQLTESK